MFYSLLVHIYWLMQLKIDNNCRNTNINIRDPQTQISIRNLSLSKRNWRNFKKLNRYLAMHFLADTLILETMKMCNNFSDAKVTLHSQMSVRSSVSHRNPSTAWNHHPSSFILQPSSFFIHPSSFYLHFATFKLFSLFLWIFPHIMF